MKIPLKKFLHAIRENPILAIQMLDEQPELATMTWHKSNKWIDGSTALHWAAHEGDLEMVKKLVELGADVNADKADWWTRPIEWAADAARYEVVQYLIEQGASLDGDIWSDCTPLHAVAQGGSSNGRKRSKAYAKTAEALIQGGAEVNAIAMYGGKPPKLTPLDDAQRVGNKAVEAVLVKHGAKLASFFKA